METILLAAGQSSRMGENKALLEINGKTVINLIIEKLIPLSNKIFLILGDNYQQVENFLLREGSLDPKIKLVYNEDHLKGMFSSIMKGFKSTSGHDLILLQMIDQPFVEIEIYEQLIRSADESNLIFQPSGQVGSSLKAGHPILFSGKFREIIAANLQMGNLRDIIRKFPGKRKFISTEKYSIFLNLNTPEDIKRYLTRE